MAQQLERFDLVIVGASFAGLAAARTAAMRGLKVAVLETKNEAGARVHTSGILVKEATEEIDIPHELTRRVHGVRLYAPNHAHVDLFAPGYFFLTTRTADLLRWLAEEVMRAGAKIYFGARFDSAVRLSDPKEGNYFQIWNPELRTRYIVGADGARSQVARCFGLGRNNRFLIGQEAEYKGLSDVDGRFLHCFVDSRLAPGYLAWLAPGPETTQVGLAVHGNAKPDLTAFLACTKGLFDYEKAEIVERRAGRIPSGGLVNPFAAPGVLLIGDAAGHVSPLTGGGIRLAFHFGKRAAHAIASHLLDFGPPPEAVMSREQPKFAIKKFFRRILELAPPNALLNAGLFAPPVRALAQHIYFHRRGGGGITFADFQAQIDSGHQNSLSPQHLGN